MAVHIFAIRVVAIVVVTFSAPEHHDVEIKTVNFSPLDDISVNFSGVKSLALALSNPNKVVFQADVV